MSHVKYGPDQTMEQQYGVDTKTRKRAKRRTVALYSSLLFGKKYRLAPLSKDPRYMAPMLQAHPYYSYHMRSPHQFQGDPLSSLTSKFIHTSINKIKTAIYCGTWTHQARRFITGASSGEFTLWKDQQFNFETILQAHEDPVRALKVTPDGNFFISADNSGQVKIWETSFNCLKTVQAHKVQVRSLSCSPNGGKYVSVSDDSFGKIWDFLTHTQISKLSGHGWDVKACDWHPYKSLIATGSKNNLIKLWDPRLNQDNCIATLHQHKSAVTSLEWNKNREYLLLSGSRDSSAQLVDIRMLSQNSLIKDKNGKPLPNLPGHSKSAVIGSYSVYDEVDSVSWHPVHEYMFVSGGSNGDVNFWDANISLKPISQIISAHLNHIWVLAWHPVGHVLATCSSDYTTKFWARNRPGDPLLDQFNAKLERNGIFLEGKYPFYGINDDPEYLQEWPQIEAVPQEVYFRMKQTESYSDEEEEILPDQNEEAHGQKEEQDGNYADMEDEDQQIDSLLNQLDDDDQVQSKVTKRIVPDEDVGDLLDMLDAEEEDTASLRSPSKKRIKRS